MRVIEGARRDRQRFVEPTLTNLFDDPLVRLLMTSDGVEPRRLWELLVEIAQRRSRSPVSCRASTLPGTWTAALACLRRGPLALLEESGSSLGQEPRQRS